MTDDGERIAKNEAHVENLNKRADKIDTRLDGVDKKFWGVAAAVLLFLADAIKDFLK